MAVLGGGGSRQVTQTPLPPTLRLIDSCIIQLKAQGPSRTCNESKEERAPLPPTSPPSGIKPPLSIPLICTAGRRFQRAPIQIKDIKKRFVLTLRARGPPARTFKRPVRSEEHTALEATPGQIDVFFCQLPYKCYLEEVASVGD